MVKKNTNILTISLFIIELKNYIVSKTARKQTKNMLFTLDKEPDLALISPKTGKIVLINHAFYSNHHTFTSYTP
jgi:hypothetical protein